MTVIRIPKTPAKAFNKDRPLSDLLKGQIEHLEWAIRPAAERSPSNMKSIKRHMPTTEGEAAVRIEELTRRLHPGGAAVQPPSPAAAGPAPVLSPSGTRKKTTHARRGTKRMKTATKKKRAKYARRAAKGVRRRGRRK